MEKLNIRYFDENEEIKFRIIEIEDDKKEKALEILNKHAKPTKIEVKSFSIEHAIFFYNTFLWYINIKLMEQIIKEILKIKEERENGRKNSGQ